MSARTTEDKDERIPFPGMGFFVEAEAVQGPAAVEPGRHRREGPPEEEPAPSAAPEALPEASYEPTNPSLQTVPLLGFPPEVFSAEMTLERAIPRPTARPGLLRWIEELCGPLFYRRCQRAGFAADGHLRHAFQAMACTLAIVVRPLLGKMTAAQVDEALAMLWFYALVSEFPVRRTKRFPPLSVAAGLRAALVQACQSEQWAGLGKIAGGQELLAELQKRALARMPPEEAWLLCVWAESASAADLPQQWMLEPARRVLEFVGRAVTRYSGQIKAQATALARHQQAVAAEPSGSPH